MPPFARPVEKGSSRHTAAGPPEAQRSASFHWRTGEKQGHMLEQRPWTQPDLLAGVRGRNFRACADGETLARRAPSKVLVTVAVQQSMWPLHIMASTEWSVANLVAAAVELYVREGRRPLLPSTNPSAFGLHYSQFSLESLEPKDKLIELGSRSFFLCPKSTATAGTSPACSSTEANKTATTTKPRIVPWLGFMHFWPLL